MIKNTDFKLGWRETLKVTLAGRRDVRLTKWLQLLHHLLPHGLNVDAGEAPLGRHFDEVRPFVAVWKDVAEKLCVVKQVLAVCKVPRPERKEGREQHLRRTRLLETADSNLGLRKVAGFTRESVLIRGQLGSASLLGHSPGENSNLDTHSWHWCTF